MVLWKVSLSLALTLALVISAISPSAVLAQPDRKHKAQASQWHLVFSDEFDGTTLDQTKWQTRFPWGRDRSSVGELQYYAPDAFRQSNGTLQIIAERNPEGNSHRYDSGLISSHSSFATRHGRFEIRCKVPAGKGLWPAFWLLPTDTSWPPEIDVFEILGHETDTVHMNVHWGKGGAHYHDKGEYTGPDFSEGFHTFAVEWGPNQLTWFVDGEQRHQVKGHSPQKPMYVLANLAVGGDWPGAPDPTTAFPSTLEIDYIRIFKADTKRGNGHGGKDKDKKSKKDEKRKGKKGKHSRHDAKNARRRASRWSR